MAVLNTLAPVFLMIALGAVLTARGWLAPDLLRGLNRLAYWIGLPCLLFASVCRLESITDRPLRIFGVLLAGTLAAGLIGWIAARALRLPRASIGTFVQGAFRGNLALLAFPITAYAFNQPGAGESAATVLPVVALAIAPLMILYNLFAAAVLLASQHGAERTPVHAFVRQLMFHPLVLAIAAGWLVSITRFPLPGFLFETIRTIGGLAIPLALFGIGGTLVLTPVRPHLRAAGTGALIKVAVTPLVGVLLARALHFPAVDVQIIGILLAAPTAAASFVMASQMKGDAGLASSLVAVTTVLSAASLGLVLAIL